MCLAFHIWALLLGKEGEAAGWNIALHACATRRAHGRWELAKRMHGAARNAWHGLQEHDD